MKVTVTNAGLAALARAEVGRHKALTPERCAAAALWIALGDTTTIDAARRALATFGTGQGRSGAPELPGRLIVAIGQDHDAAKDTAP